MRCRAVLSLPQGKARFRKQELKAHVQACGLAPLWAEAYQGRGAGRMGSLVSKEKEAQRLQPWRLLETCKGSSRAALSIAQFKVNCGPKWAVTAGLVDNVLTMSTKMPL